ncbi:MAG: hypothetical protein IKH36_01845 [Bacilli bacterium]|nr:hypothetical protein [Bacilli bacterium]
MNLEDIKDKKSLTWGDLIDCIESILKDVDKDTTDIESIERYEQFQVDMKKRFDNKKENDPNSEIISLFGIALDFILTVSVKIHYKFIGLSLFRHDMDALGDLDEDQTTQLLSTIVLILKMCKHSGKIISLDQCEFVNREELN